MTIEWQSEHVIHLRDVPKHVKSRMSGKKMAVATAWRWALDKKNPYPLETFKTPGGRFTSIEAIDRFLERCSGNKNGTSADGADTQEIAKAYHRAVQAGQALDKLVRPSRRKQH